jgi:hypothetical protein
LKKCLAFFSGNVFHRLVKEVNTVKTAGLDARLEALLHRLLGKIPFLQLINSHRCGVPKHPKLTGFQPDLIAEVHAGNRLWTLLIETEQIGQPRQIRNAALQLSSYLAAFPDNSPRYGIVLAPFISQQSAQICEEADLGYADLAGRARISFENVYIETRAVDNPFRERKEVKSLFAPKACRVLKVLLQGPIALVEDNRARKRIKRQHGLGERGPTTAHRP